MIRKQIITDCFGQKQKIVSKVSGVFFENFDIHSFQSEDIKTPLSIEDGFEVTRNRLRILSSQLPQTGDDLFVTIQRGFFFDGFFWHLFALSGVSVPFKTQSIEMSSSVQLTKYVSFKKQSNINLNIKDLLLEEFPSWEIEKMSVYTLLTGKDESSWLEDSLTNAINSVVRLNKTL